MFQVPPQTKYWHGENVRTVQLQGCDCALTFVEPKLWYLQIYVCFRNWILNCVVFFFLYCPKSSMTWMVWLSMDESSMKSIRYSSWQCYFCNRSIFKSLSINNMHLQHKNIKVPTLISCITFITEGWCVWNNENLPVMYWFSHCVQMKLSTHHLHVTHQLLVQMLLQSRTDLYQANGSASLWDLTPLSVFGHT